MKTGKPIVLSIFGGECCVTTLTDLEVAAHVIHRKAVRGSVEGSNPSTPVTEIESRKTLINENSKPDEKAIL
jgi:hypothetical protein